MSELKLEIGSFYKRRDGVVTQIVRPNNSERYPFMSDLVNTYMSNGKYDAYGEHALDLVEKVEVGTPSPAVISSRIPNQVVTPGKKHKHADIIKAWADGAVIEYKGPNMASWADLAAAGQSMTLWREDVEYRVKPEQLVLHVGLMTSSYNGNKRLTSSTSIEYLRGLGNTIDKVYRITINPCTKDAISIETLSS